MVMRTYNQDDGQENEGIGEKDDPSPGGKCDRLGRVLAFFHRAPVERMTNVSEHGEDDECVKRRRSMENEDEEV